MGAECSIKKLFRRVLLWPCLYTLAFWVRWPLLRLLYFLAYALPKLSKIPKIRREAANLSDPHSPLFLLQ